MYKPLPQLLYKYRDWTSPFGKTILKDNEIFFSTPSQFNDPFDCQLAPKLKGLTLSEVDRCWGSYIDRDFRPSTANARATMLQSVFDGLKDYTDHFARLAHYAAEEPGDNVGVFCLSEEPDNLLLWSHYANCHQGICIGISSFSIAKMTQQLLKERKVVLFDRVKYKEEYPNIPFVNRHMEMFCESLLTKAHDWKYEKEVRLIGVGHTGNGALLPPRSIQQIIFGLKCPKDTQLEIKELCAANGLKPAFFRASKRLYQFAIDLIPMD